MLIAFLYPSTYTTPSSDLCVGYRSLQRCICNSLFDQCLTASDPVNNNCYYYTHGHVEAEWELAARGGADHINVTHSYLFPWGNIINGKREESEAQSGRRVKYRANIFHVRIDAGISDDRCPMTYACIRYHVHHKHVCTHVRRPVNILCMCVRPRPPDTIVYTYSLSTQLTSSTHLTIIWLPTHTSYYLGYTSSDRKVIVIYVYCKGSSRGNKNRRAAYFSCYSFICRK